MAYRKINLGATAISFGFALAPATEIKRLCAPIAGTAALNLAAGAFVSPLPGTRWRIKVTIGPSGAACVVTLRAKLYAGLPLPSREVLSFGPGGGSRTTASEYATVVSVVSDVAPGDQVKVEFEIVGVQMAGDNALPLEGVSVGTDDVPQYSFATIEDSGSQLVRVDPLEALIVGKEVVSAAGGLGKMRGMADTGAILGRNYSASIIPKGGQTFMSVSIDPREP